MHQSFRKATVARIRFRPRQGPPITSATFGLYDKNNGEITAPTAAVVPTVDTTLNMVGGVDEGEGVLTLAAITDIVSGGRYWVGDVGSSSLEMVRVRSIDSGSKTVELVEPLMHDHRNGEAFKGADIYYDLDTTETADVDENYRVDWTYTVGSDPYSASVTIDIVERVFALVLTPDELAARIPNSLRRSIKSVFDMDDLIEAAEGDVKRRLARLRINPDHIRDLDQLSYVGLKSIEVILCQRSRLDPDFREMLEEVKDELEEEWGRLEAARFTWVDKNQDLAVTTSSDDYADVADETLVAGVVRIPIG